jgi:hypothetical protein
MPFLILVKNESSLATKDLKKYISAINFQLKNHFYPAWKIKAECIFRGDYDGILYIQDKPTIDEAGGYHDYDPLKLIPEAFCFKDVSTELNEAFSVTISHEVLEMVLNRHGNYFAIGQHPKDRRKKAAVWLEACDAVQDQTYFIRDVEVSDFVYPYYFTPHNEKAGQNNFLGEKPVRSFGATEGGYVGYFDFDKREMETYFPSDKSVLRDQIKAKIGQKRRRSRLEL